MGTRIHHSRHLHAFLLGCFLSVLTLWPHAGRQEKVITMQHSLGYCPNTLFLGGRDSSYLAVVMILGLCRVSVMGWYTGPIC